MKSIWLGIIGIMLLLVGCSRSVDGRLVCVNRLCDSNDADSAIAVLKVVCRDSLSEHSRYYYDLMSIKARDKAYQDITGDTIITDIISYFERNGSEAELGEAYYYGGRVRREQGDAPQALDYFQKSLDALTSQEHLHRKGKIASQMGQIFLELYMFEQAKPKFQEAIAYQTACRDSVGLMYNNSSLANTYQSLAVLDSSIICYRKSIDLAHNLFPNEIDEVESRIALINFLVKQKNYEQAVKEYKKVEPLLPKIDITNYVRMTSLNISLILKDYKKAEAIALGLLKVASLNCREFAYNALKEIAEYRNDAKKLYHYTKKYNEIVDSINSQSSQEAVIYQDSLYNYSLREKKNLQLELKKTRNLIISFIIVSGLLLILLIIVLIYKKVKTQNGILFSDNVLLQNKNEELSSSYDKLLLSSERTKTELKKQYQMIKTLENENVTLKVGLFDNAETIIEISDNIRTLVSERIKNIDLGNNVLPNELLSSNIYIRFETAMTESLVKLSKEDWLELDILINRLYPNFKNRILILNNRLREEEYRLSLLVKCRFSINGMAYLMNYEKSNIHKMRERMYKKLFGVEGKAVDFDKFIVSL